MADVVVSSDNTNPKELLGQGIRAYVLQDYTSAVAALSKASELLVAEHGDDLHDSLADVYLYYGKALLGLSREDSEALGDAVRNKDESDEEDEEEVENRETEGGDEKEVTENAEANGTVSSSEEKKEGSSSEADTNVESNGDEKDCEPSASTSADGVEENADAEDEPTDLQVAWEVLELAKTIYKKRGEDGKKNLAETLVILGEVSLESENFESAINDIKEGLRMQKELFPDDSRTVAETFYKLGVAYSTDTQIDEAVESFQSSLRYLQNRINNLEKAGDGKDEVAEEIEEIKGLVPDIEEKIADMKSYKDETMKQIMSAVAESKPTSSAAGGPSSSVSADSSTSKPASDISHLVKRKRKLDEIAEESEKDVEASPAKKVPS
ncbi:protein HGV2 [Anoplophora glabripennis]|nr:protein HGV2 [Anoplophora glabripennis]XP_018575372.1 protein HGV2 [Anoplophora glabripennis]